MFRTLFCSLRELTALLHLRKLVHTQVALFPEGTKWSTNYPSAVGKLLHETSLLHCTVYTFVSVPGVVFIQLEGYSMYAMIHAVKICLSVIKGSALMDLRHIDQ
jgi:hypothetical protein